MTAIMRMRSLLIPTVCGGIGDSTILGDGVRHGIITVGMVRDIGMEVIGEDGLIITTIITITITIILIMLGVVSVVIGAVAMVGMVLVPAIRVSMLADIQIIMVHPVLPAVEW